VWFVVLNGFVVFPWDLLLLKLAVLIGLRSAQQALRHRAHGLLDGNAEGVHEIPRVAILNVASRAGVGCPSVTAR
jgi:hypothetical protein